MLEFAKCAFYAETVAVKTDNCHGILFQASADKYALLSAILHQDKTQLLVQLLPPEQVRDLITHFFLFSVKLHVCFLRLAAAQAEKVR